MAATVAALPICRLLAPSKPLPSRLDIPWTPLPRRRGGPQSKSSGLAEDTLRAPRHTREAGTWLGLERERTDRAFRFPSAGLDAGVALYAGVNLASPVPWVSFGTRTPLAPGLIYFAPPIHDQESYRCRNRRHRGRSKSHQGRLFCGFLTIGLRFSEIMLAV